MRSRILRNSSGESSFGSGIFQSSRRRVRTSGHSSPQPIVIAASYSTLDINGDGIYWLNTIGLNGHFYRLLPYLITLIVLAFTSKSSRAPKAEGIPYDKGTR